MISVSHVSKSFGSIKALENITFTINPKEIVGFLGPNGAGKTTLMRLLTGILPPSQGQILIQNQSIAESKERRRKIGYLAEHNPLYREMTTYDFLKYVAALKEIPRPQQKKVVTDVSEQCSVTSVLNRIIGKLSKGYQQRIGLAQALLGDPDVLILDEPTNGLDPQQIIEVRKLIQQLGKERTVILSTHILHEVQQTCGRVLILNHGKLAALLEMKQDKMNLEEIFLNIVTKESELCPKQ